MIRLLKKIFNKGKVEEVIKSEEIVEKESVEVCISDSCFERKVSNRRLTFDTLSNELESIIKNNKIHYSNDGILEILMLSEASHINGLRNFVDDSERVSACDIMYLDHKKASKIIDEVREQRRRAKKSWEYNCMKVLNDCGIKIEFKQTNIPLRQGIIIIREIPFKYKNYDYSELRSFELDTSKIK